MRCKNMNREWEKRRGFGKEFYKVLLKRRQVLVFICVVMCSFIAVYGGACNAVGEPNDECRSKDCNNLYLDVLDQNYGTVAECQERLRLRRKKLASLLSSIRGDDAKRTADVLKEREDYISYVRAEHGNHFKTPRLPGSSDEANAAAFLRQWQSVGVDDSPLVEFRQTRKKKMFNGDLLLGYKQYYSGLEVLGGGAGVRLNTEGDVVRFDIGGLRDFEPFESSRVSLEPELSANQSGQLALEWMVSQGGDTKKLYYVSTPELKIYNIASYLDEEAIKLLGFNIDPSLEWCIKIYRKSDDRIVAYVRVNASNGAVYEQI